VKIQIIIIDWLFFLEVAILFVVLLIWLPHKIWSTNQKDGEKSSIVSCFVRTNLFIIIAILVLARFELLSWLTLVLLYGSYLFLGWLGVRGWQIQKYVTEFYQQILFVVFDALDLGLSLKQIKQVFWQSCQLAKKEYMGAIKFLHLEQPKRLLLFLALTIVVSFALLIRLEHPLDQLRLGHPDSYRSLLESRQILAGTWPQVNYLPVFSALVAFLSLLGSIDAMQVVRFLGPILGLLLALSVGYSVRALTCNGPAALVATFSLGAYLFTSDIEIPSAIPSWYAQLFRTITDSLNSSLIRQWTGKELEIGGIFLVLALGCCCARKFKTAAIDTICCLAIVAMTAPILLILALIAAIGLIGGRRFGLTLVSMSWLSLALLAAIPQTPFNWTQSFLLTLPVGLSLLVGLLFLIPISLLRLISDRWAESVCVILFFVVSINFFLPLSTQVTYLEYDIAARKTLEIRNLFPAKSWTIVAPVEQLAESYGAGWYEDLGLFVEKYSAKIDKAGFKFPYTSPHLFVYVEKQPFVTLSQENKIVPYWLFADPTYRYYRSASGRASLQFEALKMCETYRRNHNNVSIYYEDEQLKIYHFQGAGERGREGEKANDY
jgi:hypothetical protein